MVNKNCQSCGKEYSVKNYRKNKSKFCSKICQCSAIGKVGGAKGKGISRNLGAKHAYLSEYNRNNPKIGKENPAWKGIKVGYHALHMWICKHFGYPTECEHCKKIETNNRKIHWANRSGQYQRYRSDWLRLCASCHRKYDLNRKAQSLAVNI